MGARRIFSRGGQWGSLKDGSPPAGSTGSSPVGVWCRAPRGWWHFLKMMHEYFIYWGFRQHLQQKTLFNRCPLAHACGHPCSQKMVSQNDRIHTDTVQLRSCATNYFCFTCRILKKTDIVNHLMVKYPYNTISTQFTTWIIMSTHNKFKLYRLTITALCTVETTC